MEIITTWRFITLILISLIVLGFACSKEQADAGQMGGFETTNDNTNQNANNNSPAEQVFKIENAEKYLDYDKLTEKFGLIEEPMVLSYQISNSAIDGITIDRKTSSRKFNKEIIDIVKSWTYTAYGQGRIKITLDMLEEEIAIDVSGIERPNNAPNGKLGYNRELIATKGFENIYVIDIDIKDGVIYIYSPSDEQIGEIEEKF